MVRTDRSFLPLGCSIQLVISHPTPTPIQSQEKKEKLTFSSRSIDLTSSNTSPICSNSVISATLISPAEGTVSFPLTEMSSFSSAYSMMGVLSSGEDFEMAGAVVAILGLGAGERVGGGGGRKRKKRVDGMRLRRLRALV